MDQKAFCAALLYSLLEMLKRPLWLYKHEGHMYPGSQTDAV
jgi:hypothetical protein